MLLGPKDYLKVGDHNSFCMRCGFKYKASEIQKEWTGLLVCGDCLDQRHPQDLLRAVKESPAPKNQSPRTDGESFPLPAYRLYITSELGLVITDEDGRPIISETIASTGMIDNAGSPYFIPYGPADKTKL